MPINWNWPVIAAYNAVQILTLNMPPLDEPHNNYTEDVKLLHVISAESYVLGMSIKGI